MDGSLHLPGGDIGLLCIQGWCHTPDEGPRPTGPRRQQQQRRQEGRRRRQQQQRYLGEAHTSEGGSPPFHYPYPEDLQ